MRMQLRTGAWLSVLLAMLVQTASAQVGDAQLIHSERSLYRQVLVYQDGSTRCLCFTRGCSIGRQSCVDLQQPQRLVFQYTQMMLGALFLAPEPRDILIIGLGGGTLPVTLERLLPQARIDVVEIDPAVVSVAQRYFDFHTNERLHVVTQDGRIYIRQTARTGKQYDLVMLDAYDNQYIPEHLLTREFLTEVKSLLRPGGILAANTFSQSRLYASESVTYHSVFGEFYNLKSDNRVILTSNGPLLPLDQVTRNSQRFEQPFAALGVSRQTLLERFNTQVDWDAKARVLTDQFSPANLLNGPR
jgi:spermidine synthase